MAEQTIHLLIIDESSSDAELITNILRNAGLAVRARRIVSLDDMNEALDEQRWDMVMGPVSDSYGAFQAAAELRSQERDVPVIAINKNQPDLTPTKAMQAGARDLVNFDDHEHIQLVVRRELDNLLQQRAHRASTVALRESEKRCKQLIDNSRDAITYVHEGMHIYANSVYLEMFGYPDADEIEGMPIMDMVAPADHASFKSFLRSFGKDSEQLEGELEVRGVRTDGKEFDALMEFTPATIDGESCTQIIIRQQADKEMVQQLKMLSQQDLLTGLYNRAYFMEKLDGALSNAGSGGGNTGLLYLQLDNIAQINESMSIASGDLLLSDVAKTIQATLPEDDIAARFQGGTFTILSHAETSNDIKAMAKRLREVISEHISDIGGQSISSTCSIGISLITEGTKDSNIAISRAFHACEKAKTSGGNAIHVYDPKDEQDQKAGESGSWAERIKGALKNDKMLLNFQPIVSLHGISTPRYEVLLRMLDEDGSEIQPNTFLPSAERAGLMKNVDRWVIGNTMMAAMAQQKKGKRTGFFVKLSSASVTDNSFLEWINDSLKKTRIGGDLLTFEITESVAMTHLPQTKLLINGLKQLKCQIALDHFGTGLNSLSVLKQLDVDFLKIDGSLVRELSTSKENQDTVKAITDMAHSLGKETIAESVQDANSLAVIWQCGITLIQGHFLQAPSASLEYEFGAAAS